MLNNTEPRPNRYQSRHLYKYAMISKDITCNTQNLGNYKLTAKEHQDEMLQIAYMYKIKKWLKVFQRYLPR